MILGADIGGTKTLLGLAENDALVVERRYANADFADFAAVLAQFLTDTQTNPSQISGGCLAVAGPIDDDGRRARLTNLPWSIDSEALSGRFGLPAPRLVNDFAAAAIGAVTAAAQRVTLQAGDALASAPCLVVGAGTGLGMAIVLPQGQNNWRIVPGEGGHVAFAPADEAQLALWSFLHRKHGRVTWERVVSGPGLAAIHEFVAGVDLPPEEIAARALREPNGIDSAAQRSLHLFLAAYGAYAGDMALACLARGGVFLAGGIAAKLLPLLPASGFLAAFKAKAEHAAIAARMPIHVATDPALGLRGALHLARE